MIEGTSRTTALQAERIAPRSEKLSWMFVAVAVMSYGGWMFHLISRYAVNILFADQWDFDRATLFQKHSLWQRFSWQHGWHRLGVGALFQKLVDPLFVWNSRTESFVVGGVVVAATVTGLYLKRRIYGRISIFDIAITAILLTPAQYESVFISANFSQGALTIILILLFLLVWSLDRTTLRYFLLLLLNFAAIYTGFGLFLGILTPILFCIERVGTAAESRMHPAKFGALLAVSIGSFAAFFRLYNFYPGMGCYSSVGTRAYLEFVVLVFANFFSVNSTHGVVFVLGCGLLLALLISLIAAGWRLLSKKVPDISRIDQDRHLISAALIALTILVCLVTAHGRVCDGLAMALAPRYVIYLEPGMLGFYFFLLTIKHQRTQRLCLIGFLLVAITASLRVDQSAMAYPSEAKQLWKTCYLQTEEIQHCNEVAGLPIYAPPRVVRLRGELQYLKQTRQNLYADSSER